MEIKHSRSAGEVVLYSSFVQLILFIILSIAVAEVLLIVLSYFRFSFPEWLDEALFNPTLLIVLLSPFSTPENEVSILVFDPTLFAILLSPVVYFALFRPWVNRIAERKSAEEMRIEKEKIEYARSVKNEFLHILSHEMRTHLNSIIGFSELLKQKTAGELNAKQEQFASNILKSGNMQLALISDLLDLNKIETGKMELVIEKMHVPEAVDEALALVKEKAEKQNVLLKKYLDPALDFMEADRHIVRQVLYNLLDNAVKFSKPEGGNVTITTKRKGDAAEFSVSDNGTGISTEDMTKLFTQFPHIDSGGTRKNEGTGLGLALSQKLAELHGGKITAESRFGEGSTFTLMLPVKAEIKGRC